MLHCHAQNQPTVLTKDMAPEVRRAVLQQFQAQGLFLERAALDRLTEYVASVKDTNGAIEALLDALELGRFPCSLLSARKT